MELSSADVLALRMVSLLLAARPEGYGGEPAPGDVAGVVTWFGAMQAQDINSAAWSFGVRLPGVTTADLEEAFERREAIRTWPMRGTVHYVPPADAHWMLELMGSRALAGAAKRRAMLGLDDAVADAAVEVLGTTLAGGKRLTRAQCLDALRDSGIEVSGQLGYHLLWYASQRGVTCFAPNIGNQQAFTLLDEWVPKPTRLDPEEALATIAHRYFRSHGPTTAPDFAGWTGLPVTQCRRGIAALGDELAEVSVDGVRMHADRALLECYRPAKRSRDVRALPGFDEYMLGYKDRSLMLDDEHKQAVVPGGNGVFQPTIVAGGRVVGTWRREIKRGTAVVAITPLAKLPNQAAINRAFEPYGRFLGRPLSVTIGS
jgi:winged helix DNA-binding protein